MIQVQSIDGLLLREMAVSGAALLEKNREAVDALNVFPVPDGDTGTNMSPDHGQRHRAKSTSKEYVSAGEAAAASGQGRAARRARQQRRHHRPSCTAAFLARWRALESITPVQFAQALQAGAETAYKAVMKPQGGHHPDRRARHC